MERRLYDNSQVRRITKDERHGVIPNLRVSSVHAYYFTCISSERQIGGNHGLQNKSLACRSRTRARFSIILASEYPICSFLLTLIISVQLFWVLLYLPGWLVLGALRISSARDRGGWLCAGKGYMGKLGQVVSIHSLRLASLI